jgi:hypothetical protein
MDDQYQCNQAVAKYRTDLQVAEAVCQLLLQTEVAEQGLKQNQPGEGSQFLVFKMNVGNAMSFTMDIGFATLHVDGLLWFYCLVGANNFTKSGPFFICQGDDYLGFFW